MPARGGRTSSANCGRGKAEPGDASNDPVVKPPDPCKHDRSKSWAPQSHCEVGDFAFAPVEMAGADVPDEIRCIDILRVLLQVNRGLHVGFTEFLRKSLVRARDVDRSEHRSDPWPCPVPLWRWTGPSKLSPQRRRRRRRLEVKRRYLQQVVVLLNWLTLGHAKHPPAYARCGYPMSQVQREMLERLESMLDYFMDAPAAKLADLGRASEKLGKLSAASFKLHDEFSEGDLFSFLQRISRDIDPYGKPPGSDKTDRNSHSKQTESKQQGDSQASQAPSVLNPACSAEGAKVGCRVSLTTSAAKQVEADRIKWKLGPSFDPQEFLPDPIVRAAYDNPEILRKPASSWPKRPKALVRCSKSELLKLAKKWDKLGACRLVACDEVNEDEPVGLFAVGKDADWDRLIINPTTINSRQYSYSNYTRAPAPGCMVGLIRLEPSQNLVVSSDDLCEY